MCRDKYGRSPLFYATTTKEAKLYLSWGANANETDQYGGTPLLMAIGDNNIELAEFLISHGAVVNSQNSALLLFDAIGPKVEQKEMVELLLRNGADPNITFKKGATPIELAFEQNYMDTVAILYRYGAKITTIECAVAVNDISKIKKLLENPNNSPNYYRLLYYSTSAEVAELMVNKGAYFNPRTNGVEMMERAARFGYREKVAFLLSKDVCVDSIVDKDMKLTPLAIAASKSRYDVVELLINRGANVNFKGKDNYTPLDYAVIGGNYKVVALLLSKGADVKNRTGKSLLHLARECGHNEIADLLRRYGVKR
jgi:ankyrin repeat protein